MICGVKSTLVLLCVIGAFCTTEAEDLQEGVFNVKCESATTRLILTDSCGSYCQCSPYNIVAHCEKKKCPPGEELYSPVGDYEVDMDPKLVDFCEPGQMFNDGCNQCKCKVDGTRGKCTRKSCNRRLVYRKKE